MDKSNKKQIIKIIIVIAIIVAANVLFTILLNDLFFKHTEGLVYRTRTGECYHSPGCGYLWSSAIPMGIEQARASSLRVCSRCLGIPKGTIEVNNYFGAFAITFLLEIGITLLVLFIRYKLTEKPATSNPTTHAFTTSNATSNISSALQITQKPLEKKTIIPIRKGSIVKHPKWGNGEVTLIEDGYITICFVSSQFKTHNEGIKKFQYPDAVGKYFEVVEY